MASGLESSTISREATVRPATLAGTTTCSFISGLVLVISSPSATHAAPAPLARTGMRNSLAVVLATVATFGLNGRAVALSGSMMRRAYSGGRMPLLPSVAVRKCAASAMMWCPFQAA